MTRPILQTMPVSTIGRETDQNIRKLHGYLGDLEARVTALAATVAAIPAVPTTADIAAIAATTTPIAVAGLAGGPSAGPPPSPTPVTPPGDPTVPPDHLAEVVAAKADAISDGVSLVGDCGAFEITKRCAWALHGLGESAGLLDKPGGANCDGYAAAIICYPTGQIFDILVDAGGANTPQWSDGGFVDPSRYRPPFAP